MAGDLLTIPEACQALLNLKPQRVYEMARQGILPPGVIVRLGRQIRINESKLREWIESGGQSLPGGWRRRPKKSSQ